MNTNLRVIDGERGKLPDDASFAEFCRAAVSSVVGGDDDYSWIWYGECTYRSLGEGTLQQRIAGLSNWSCATLPVWAAEQTPSQRLDVIDGRLGASIHDWNGQCVLLTGPTGAGKTTAAVHLLLAFWERSIRRAIQVVATKQRKIPLAQWITATKLERARREHPLGQGEAEVVTDAIEADILVIDDLGQEASRGETVIFDALNERYERKRPTIVTSGLTVAELGTRYGNHLLRRLTDHARGCRLGEAW